MRPMELTATLYHSKTGKIFSTVWSSKLHIYALFFAWLWLNRQICFFSREDYHQLVFGALTTKTGKIKTVPPCILKPEALWSGKQVRTFAKRL